MLILMLEMCTVNSHSQGTCVLLEIPSMHKLIQYFQSLYTCRNEDIYELKGVHIANIEDDLCSSSVEYSSISNVNSYLLLINVDSGLQELYLPLLVKRHIMPVDLSEG